MSSGLEALQRQDPKIQSMVVSSKFAAAYLLQQEGPSPGWRKANIEGPVYLVRRRSAPFYQVLVKNQYSANDLCENLHPDWELECQKNYIFFKVEDPSKRVRGLWFHDDSERQKVETALQQALEELRKPPVQQPPVQPQVSLRPSMARSNVRPIELTKDYVQEVALSAKGRRATGSHGVADVTDALVDLGKDTPGHVRCGAELSGSAAKLCGKLVPLEHFRPGSGAPVWYVKDIADIAQQSMGTGWKKLQARCRMHGDTQRFYCEGFGDANGFLEAEEGETWAFVLTDAGRDAGDYKMYTLPKEELYLSKCRNGEFRFTRYQSSTAGSHTSKRWVHHTTFFGNESPIYAAGVICKRKNIFYYKMQTGHYGRNQDLNQFKRLTSEFFAAEVAKGQALRGAYLYEDR